MGLEKIPTFYEDTAEETVAFERAGAVRLFLSLADDLDTQVLCNEDVADTC